MNDIRYSATVNGWYVADENGDARGGIHDSYAEALEERNEFEREAAAREWELSW